MSTGLNRSASPAGSPGCGSGELTDEKIGLLVLDRTSEGVIIVQDGFVRYCNQTALNISGYARERYLGTPIFQMIHPEDRPELLARLQGRLVDRPNAARHQARFLRPDGRVIWLESHSEPISWREKPAVLVIFYDVTEQKGAEEELRRRTATLDSIYRAAPMGVGLVRGAERVVVWANERLAVLTGYREEELEGMPARLLYESEEAYVRVGRIRQAQLRDRGWSAVETRWRKKDGRSFDVLLSSSEWLPGEFDAGLVFTVSDITESKRTKAALQLNEQRLEALLRLHQLSFPSVAAITDFALEEGIRLTGSEVGYLAFLNENETIMTMYSWSRTALARCVTEDKPLVYQVEHTGLWGEAVRQRRPVVTNDYRAVNPLKRGLPPGHVPILRHMNVPVFEENRIVAVAGVGNKREPYDEADVRQLTLLMQGLWRIVRRRRDEEELAAMETQLRQAQKMQALGTLAGGFAHDFNNILTAILGYGELAREAARLGRPSRGELDRMLAAAERARDLVGEILAFSRQRELETVPLDLNEEVRLAARNLERSLPPGVQVSLELAPNLPSILGEPGSLEEIIQNLGSNAGHAMPRGGRLEFRSELVELAAPPAERLGLAPGPYAVLEARDTGAGMDEETQRRIFDPFFTTKETGQGTGLGLSTVFGIMQSLAGHVTCESAPGQGATFRLWFPLAAGATADQPAPEAGAAAARSGRRTILIVDDDEFSREAGQRLLQREGYRVVLAAGGEEALELIRQGQPAIDLVLLDVSLPGLGGRRSLEQLRELDPTVRVIILGSYAGAKSLAGLVQGTEGFLPKPFNRQNLLAKVRGVLDRV
ncbi:MAG: PAS domain S-box protein [Deltaproteobacteria bacterium]|nr:PAS domain S-box protein [Deltaproteobacteria bacterium]